MAFFKKEALADLENRIAELQLDNNALKEEIAENRKIISNFINVKYKYEKQITDLSREHEVKIVELNKTIETEKKSVIRKVNHTLATIGVTTFAPEEISVSDNVSPQAIYSRFIAMPNGAEKDAFFEANRKVLSEMVGLKR